MLHLLLILQAFIMNWYIAKIVFNITAENTEHKPQFDEQLRLIAAENPEEAFLKARAIGIKEEDSFFNDRQNRVKWEFINVADIHRISNLEDGSELYSHTHETEEAKNYINTIHQKAIFIRMQSKPVF
jgi:putative SOS response-associated peptidase YedK